MCTDWWQRVFSVAFLVDKWSYYVASPWRWCSSRPCTIWCLCCDRWLCWIGVIILAILVVTVWIVWSLFSLLLLTICETICVLLTIIQTRGIGSCFAARGNTAPTAVTDGPYSGLIGQSIAMSAAGSTDAEADPLSASWTLGDGTSLTGLAISHAYADVGVFTVGVTVSDNRGASSSARTTATIRGVGSGGPGVPPPPVDPIE
jgi:PKD domain